MHYQVLSKLELRCAEVAIGKEHVAKNRAVSGLTKIYLQAIKQPQRPSAAVATKRLTPCPVRGHPRVAAHITIMLLASFKSRYQANKSEYPQGYTE